MWTRLASAVVSYKLVNHGVLGFGSCWACFLFLDKMSSPSVPVGETVNYMQLYVCTGTRITDRHYVCTGTRITDRHYVCTGTRMTDRHFFCTGTRITDHHYVCTGTRLTDRHYVSTGTRITDRHYVCTGTRIPDRHYINEYYWNRVIKPHAINQLHFKLWPTLRTMDNSFVLFASSGKNTN